MSPLAEVQAAITRVCFDDEPRAEDLALLEGDAERWRLYRRMVRHRLIDMMRAGLPRAAELLGPERFHGSASRYLAEGGPRTRFIREVVHELVEHASPRWALDPSLPPHFAELVRYEEAKWRVASMPAEVPEAGELDFEAPMVWNPVLVSVPLRHRVDKDAAAPVQLEQPHVALVYRKPGQPNVFTYVVNDVGSRLVAAWRGGLSGADGARAVLAELGRPADARFVEGMASVLADLVEQRIVLGSRVAR